VAEASRGETTTPAKAAHGLAQLRLAVAALDAVPRGQLNLEALTAIHRLMLTPAPAAGQLRSGPGVIWLHGQVHRRLPLPEEARRLASEALAWLDDVAGGQHPVSCSRQIAAEAVFRLTEAHPFIDGNGRIARAAGAWILIRGGYGLAVDPGTFFHLRTDMCYSALAARQAPGPEGADPAPWQEFFHLVVASCFSVPPSLRCRRHFEETLGLPSQDHRLSSGIRS
jgi:fido (protein-threonine AMPylation protein)